MNIHADAAGVRIRPLPKHTEGNMPVDPTLKTAPLPLTKRCGGMCKQIKPHAAFYKKSRSTDGLQPYCKECQVQYREQRAEKLAAQAALEKAEIAQKKREPKERQCQGECGQVRPIEDFHKAGTQNRHGVPYRRTICRFCVSAQGKKDYARAKEAPQDGEAVFVPSIKGYTFAHLWAAGTVGWVLGGVATVLGLWLGGALG